MKKLTVFILLLIGLAPSSFAENRDFYQIKIYHLKNDEQEKRVDRFLETAYLPALHRANVKQVGVFKPVETNSNEKLIYVFIPHVSYESFSKLEARLHEDAIYQKDGSDYINATYDAPPYERIETILLHAFEKSPHFNLPSLTSPKSERIYELRSYEGPTEKYYQNKVQMFNKGDEVGLFKRLGFNAVFYGEVVAGSRMPNLMYMTTFENKKARDEHWDTFGKDAYWKKLSAMPEYQHNVSKSDIHFLYPTAYSDF